MSEQISPELVFKNLQKILNTMNSRVIVLKETIRVLILVKRTDEQAEGLIAIGKKVLPIKVEYHNNGNDSILAVEIGKGHSIYYTLEGEELMELLSKIRKEGEGQ